MSEQKPSSEITDRLDPPPLLWTKRLGKSLLALFIALVVARLLWGYLAARKLREAMDDLVARGLPTTRRLAEDPPVPDDQNAALVWIAAMNAINQNVNTPSQSSGT